MEETSVVESAAPLLHASRPPTACETKRATAPRNAGAGALPSAVVELALAPAGHPLATRQVLIGIVARRCALRATVIRGTIVGGAISVACRLGHANVAATAADRRRAAATFNRVTTGAGAIRVAPATARLPIAAVEYAAHRAITGFGTIGRGVLGSPIGEASRCRLIGRIHETTAIAARPEPASRVVAVDQTPTSKSDQAEDGPHEERALHWITAAPTDT
jgi:hypothetical protein